MKGYVKSATDRYIMVALIVGVLLAVVFALREDQATLEDDAKRLQGRWRSVYMQSGSHTVETSRQFFSFDGETFAYGVEGGILHKGTFTLDSSSSPKTLDLAVTESGKEPIGRPLILGIYELDNETLKLCFARPGEKRRPKEFPYEQGSMHELIAFTKEKP
jgi:uncharacterized protein (TIGR03067 family)